MIRFFRQIRQRLLPIAIGTDNKFSKYLLYAVGEILKDTDLEMLDRSIEKSLY